MDGIPAKIKEIVSSWQIVSKKIKNIKERDGYEVVYIKGGIKCLIGIGLNGFIVSAYPKRRIKCI